MKFLRGVIHSALIGTSAEQQAVRNLLTIDGKEPYLDSENMLYSGLVDFVIDKMKGTGFQIEVEDLVEYEHPSVADIIIPEDYLQFDDPDKKLRPYQIQSIRKTIAKGRGVVEIATGGGKTEIAAAIIKYLLENELITTAFFVVETRFLMKQAAARFEARGLPNVRCVGGGFGFSTGSIHVCVIDSLLQAILEDDQVILHHLKTAGAVFYDECHHLSANSWMMVGEACQAKYRFGLTATLWSDPFKYSFKDLALIGLTGMPTTHIPSIALRKLGFLADPVVTSIKVDRPKVQVNAWDACYEEGIVRNTMRNSYMMSIAEGLYGGGYKTLVFIKYINHGLRLVRLMREMGIENVIFVKGGELMFEWKPSGRWEKTFTTIEQIAERVNNSESIVVVGTQVLDEGVDVPAFNALIMGTAMKKYRRTVQRAGRGMRPKQGDNSVYIFDFIDDVHENLLEHSIYRAATYKMEEYMVIDKLEDMCTKMGVEIDLRDSIFSFAEETVDDAHEDRKARREVKKEARREARAAARAARKRFRAAARAARRKPRW